MTFPQTNQSVPAPPRDVSYDTTTGKPVTLAMPVYDPGDVDQEFGPQWHLGYLGDLAAVWKDYTGKGVRVGLFDDGAEGWHWDIAPNYDASNNLRIGDFVVDGSWDGPYHGTACAGIIAAARNGRGGVGVAYDAKLTAVSIYNNWSPAYVDGPDFWRALKAAAAQYDVISNSWGSGGSAIKTDNSRSSPDSSASGFAKGWAALAELGRGGLGTITVKAAGNDAADNQSEGGETTRHTIIVGAYRQVDGVAASYSNCGPNLLVSAPSNDAPVLHGTGIVTTDLLGLAGINWWNDYYDDDPVVAKSDYTNWFGGTSASGPMVAGVATLMLDADPKLGWRDVRTILAQTARSPIAYETGPVLYKTIISGADRTVMMNEDRFHLGGQAAHVNGGGLHYSNDYGYGAVDAYAAVRMAEVWSLFGAAKTSGNEVHAQTRAEVELTAIGDPAALTSSRLAQSGFLAAPVRYSFQVGDRVDLEHVDLTLRFTSRLTIEDADHGRPATSYDSDMTGAQLRLIAPDGTVAFTAQPGTSSLANGMQEYTFGLAGFQGVASQGTWTLEFATYAQTVTRDGKPAIATADLTVHGLTMDLYGSAPTTDDVYSYTNEFFVMAAIDGEAGRKVLTDADGGTDWINAAAVSSDVTLSLIGGQSTFFGGQKAFALDRATVIENAVTGDGSDTLIGNRFDNRLYGMRGNDVLNGGMGDDILSGGTGSNRFLFDARSGHDTIVDWARGDILETSKALKGVGADGVLTIGANATVLLDGTASGNTVLLLSQAGAKLMEMGKRDGYFRYAYVAEAAADAGSVVQEASARPAATAAGIVEQITAATGGSANDNDHADAAPVGHAANDVHSGFYLYDAMAGSMSGGVQLFT